MSCKLFSFASFRSQVRISLTCSLLILFLMLLGCGGGGGGGGGTAEEVIKTTITISPDGGLYEVLGLILDVPVGAVDENQTIEVEKYNTADGEKIDASSITPVYSIEGFENGLNIPIEVEIPLFDKVLDVGTFTPFLVHMIENGAYSISAGTVNALSMHEALIVDGYMVATLPAAESDEILSAALSVETMKAAASKSTLQWVGGKLLSEQLSGGGDFKVIIPKDFFVVDPNLNKINNVVFWALDASVSLLGNSGFKWDILRKPIPVHITNRWWLGYLTEYHSSVLINNNNKDLKTYKEPVLYIDKNRLLEGGVSIPGKDGNLIGKIGHEFFHAVQLPYIPDFDLLGSFTFLSEASSAWFEHKLLIEYFADSYDYALFPYFPDSTCFQNYGLDGELINSEYSDSAWTGTDCSIKSSSELGYGTSYFFGHLTKYMGDKVIFDIWNHVKSGKSSMAALEQAVYDNAGYETPQDMEDAWRTFVEGYNYGSLSSGYWAGIGGTSHQYNLDDNDGIFAFKMSQYSAVSIGIVNPESGFLGGDVTITFEPQSSAEPYITAKLYDKDGFVKQLDTQKKEVITVPTTTDYGLLITYTGQEPGAIDVTLKIEKGAADISCDWSTKPAPEYCSMGGAGTVYIDTNNNPNDDTYAYCRYYNEDWGAYSGTLNMEIPVKNGLDHGRVKFYLEGKLNDYNLYENGVIIDSCD